MSRFSASTGTKPFNSSSSRAAEYLAAQPPPTVNPVSVGASMHPTLRRPHYFMETAAEAAVSGERREPWEAPSAVSSL
jgi:hypothetical protein